MKTVLVSEFKTHCTALTRQVASTKEGIIVTLRGKPMVRVLPIVVETALRPIGDTVNGAKIHGDIIETDDASSWESALS